MTSRASPGRLGAATPPPLVVLGVALAGVTAYRYLQGAYASATLLGIAAILTTLFFLLTRR